MAVRAVLCGAVLMLAGLLGSQPAWAAGATPFEAVTSADTNSDFDRDVFFFAGRFESHWFPDGLFPAEALWTPDFFENNFIVGGGYQQFSVSGMAGSSGLKRDWPHGWATASRSRGGRAG